MTKHGYKSVEIQPLPKRLYKQVYGEDYTDSWQLRFSGLTDSEKKAVETLLSQYQFKSIYWIPEVDFPECIRTPDLYVDGKRVEIKQISSIRSVREQLHKASKQINANGWTIVDATKSDIPSAKLINAIEQYGALENTSKFALV